MYDKTITILNKLPRTGTQTTDTWYKTVLNNAEYQQKTITEVNGTETSFGKKIIVLIPFNDKFLPYSEWKNRIDRGNYYTISEKDYIVLDEVVAETVTSQNIVATLKNYQDVEVRVLNIANKRGGANVQIKIEGV